jgi:hypothetical protein
MSYTDIYIAFAIASVVIAFVFYYVFSWLSELDSKYKYLNDRIDDCAKKWNLEYIDREAKEMREHLYAIENHLGIVMVKEPARLVAKNGEPK